MVEVRLKSAWYRRGVPVITDFSLYVERGGIAVVAGQSGAGKSTLLSIIASLHTGYDGFVRVGGAVALVPQKSCLLPWYTVRQNLTLVARARGIRVSRREVDDTLARLGLSEFAARRPLSLSGGQYRRAALGQAMLSGPDVLLMDEPFSALDADTKSEVMEYFSAVRRESGVTAILVTHDMREAEAIGGEIVRMGV